MGNSKQKVLPVFLIVVVLFVSSGYGQGAKELNEKLDSFLKNFKKTVKSALDIETTVLENVDQTDLLKMADVNELRINVAVFAKLQEQFQILKEDISNEKVQVPSMTYLHRLLILYKVFNVRRGEFAEIDERLILNLLVEGNKMKTQRANLNKDSKELLDILSMLGDMESATPGSVIPGQETFYTLDKLTDGMRPVFVEVVKTAVKAIRILEDIENVYTNLTEFVGPFSSSPFLQIANLAEGASEVIDVLSLETGKIFLAVNQRKIIKKKALTWFKGADGYLELVTRLELLKDLLLKITQYRNLQKWNNVEPKDFLDDNFKRTDMLVDDKGNIKRMIDEL